MLDLFVAPSEEEIQNSRLQPRISLSGPIYWFLHRYFVHASLTPGDISFLNLYEDTELTGYQLHRLKTELREALVDLSARPSSFSVFTGWTSTVCNAETEDWRTIERAEVEAKVKELILALTEAEELGHHVYAIGD